MSLPTPSIPMFARGSVSRDAVASFVYSAVVRVSTLAISVAIARVVGSAGAGALGVALQVTALCSMFAAMSLPQGLAKHLAESADTGRRRGLLRVSGGLILAGSVTAVLALLISARALAAGVYHDATLGLVLAWCGPLVLSTTAVLWVEGALQGLRRFGTLARWGAALAVLDLLAGVTAAFAGVVTVLIVRSVVRAGMVVFAAARWLRMRPDAAPAPEPAPRPRALAGSLLGFAGPTMLSAAIVLAGQTLLRLLLVRRGGLDEAGQFQAADGLAQALLLVPGAAAIAFMRAVSSGRQNAFADVPESLRRALRQVTAYNLPLVLVLIGVMPWVVVALFGAEFQPARRVLIVLAIAYGMAGPCALYGSVLLGRAEVWKAFGINLAWAVVALGAFHLATGRWGAFGAAFAVAIGYLVLLILCVALFTRRWSVPLAWVLPPILLTLGAVAVAGTLALTPIVPWWVTPLACLAGAIAIFARWGLAALAPSLARAGYRP